MATGSHENCEVAPDEGSSTEARLCRVFAHTVDLARLVERARKKAGEPDRPGRVYDVRVVRVDRVDLEPSPWVQARPHWGILVDGCFCHLAIVPERKTPAHNRCIVAWCGADHIRVRGPIVGTTVFSRKQICTVLDEVFGAFGLERPHAVYWNCMDALHTACVALCANGTLDPDGWAAVVGSADSVRAGVFALAHMPHKADPDLPCDVDDPARCASARIIGANLPRVPLQSPVCLVS